MIQWTATKKIIKRKVEYLRKTIAFINEELEREEDDLAEKKSDLIAARKDMYENTVHISSDFESLVGYEPISFAD